jgi:hypothetical protein
LIWIATAALGLIGNWLTYGTKPDGQVLAGAAIIVATATMMAAPASTCPSGFVP